MGLSVVHGIVQAHHGALRVYSQPGKGTSFQIYFPVAKGEVVREAPSDLPVPIGKGEKILFVDDESVLVFVGTMMLEQKGYRVVGTPSGEAAMREFQENPEGRHSTQLFRICRCRECRDCSWRENCGRSGKMFRLF